MVPYFIILQIAAIILYPPFRAKYLFFFSPFYLLCLAPPFQKVEKIEILLYRSIISYY